MNRDALYAWIGRAHCNRDDLPLVEMHAPENRELIYAWMGRAWSRHVRKQARQSSVYQAARNMRKAGFGLQTALILLTRAGLPTRS